MRAAIASIMVAIGLSVIALAGGGLFSTMPPWAEEASDRIGAIAVSVENHTPHVLSTNWATFYLSSGGRWIAGRIEDGQARLMHRVEGVLGGVRVDTTNVMVIPTDRLPLTTNVFQTVITVLRIEAPRDTNSARLQ